MARRHDEMRRRDVAPEIRALAQTTDGGLGHARTSRKGGGRLAGRLEIFDESHTGVEHQNWTAVKAKNGLVVIVAESGHASTVERRKTEAEIVAEVLREVCPTMAKGAKDAGLPLTTFKRVWAGGGIKTTRVREALRRINGFTAALQERLPEALDAPTTSETEALRRLLALFGAAELEQVVYSLESMASIVHPSGIPVLLRDRVADLRRVQREVLDSAEESEKVS